MLLLALAIALLPFGALALLLVLAAYEGRLLEPTVAERRAATLSAAAARAGGAARAAVAARRGGPRPPSRARPPRSPATTALQATGAPARPSPTQLTTRDDVLVDVDVSS